MRNATDYLENNNYCDAEKGQNDVGRDDDHHVDVEDTKDTGFDDGEFTGVDPGDYYDENSGQDIGYEYKENTDENSPNMAGENNPN